jgi:hypothetical protein
MSRFRVILVGLLVASTLSAKATTMGFSGTLWVLSALTSDRKAVFIVSGPCEVLLSKSTGPSGSNAQTVVTPLDHAVIVLYRTGQVYPTDQTWADECKFINKAATMQAHFQTASATYTWKDGDLTLIQTDRVQLGIGED